MGPCLEKQSATGQPRWRPVAARSSSARTLHDMIGGLPSGCGVSSSYVLTSPGRLSLCSNAGQIPLDHSRAIQPKSKQDRIKAQQETRGKIQSKHDKARHRRGKDAGKHCAHYSVGDWTRPAALQDRYNAFCEAIRPIRVGFVMLYVS